MHETRAALNEEIAGNAALYERRMTRDRCFTARLAELDRMLADWTAGRTPDRTAQPIVAEPTSSAHTAVWTAAIGGSGAATLPLEDRLRYAVIYDEVANNERNRLDERALWQRLAGYDGAARLDNGSLIALRETLAALRRLHRSDGFNFVSFRELLKPLGIRAHLIETMEQEAQDIFCAPLLK